MRASRVVIFFSLFLALGCAENRTPPSLKCAPVQTCAGGICQTIQVVCDPNPDGNFIPSALELVVRGREEGGFRIALRGVGARWALEAARVGDVAGPHHLVLSLEAGERRLYVDGVLESRETRGASDAEGIGPFSATGAAVESLEPLREPVTADDALARCRRAERLMPELRCR